MKIIQKVMNSLNPEKGTSQHRLGKEGKFCKYFPTESQEVIDEINDDFLMDFDLP